MATDILGRVFDDLNKNGVHDPGEPGIGGVYLTLYNVSEKTCKETYTNPAGIYSFAADEEGTYKIFETAAKANACPPTLFTQPGGFECSTGPRERTVKIACGPRGAVTGQDFGHAKRCKHEPCDSPCSGHWEEHCEEKERCRAITDIIESVAMEEAALSRILKAEGEKLQKAVCREGFDPCELLRFNKSVTNTLRAVTRLETVLQNKLELFEDCLCFCEEEEERKD